MNLPRINIPLVLEIWDWLQHPGEGGTPAWSQGVWATDDQDELAHSKEYSEKYKIGNADIPDDYCGSACCVAGYAMRDQTQFANGTPSLRHGFTWSPDGDTLAHDVDDWSTAAGNRLGLTGYEADLLFAGSNTKERIRSLLNEFLADRGETVRL
jgi:hypothetical protein